MSGRRNSEATNDDGCGRGYVGAARLRPPFSAHPSPLSPWHGPVPRGVAAGRRGQRRGRTISSSQMERAHNRTQPSLPTARMLPNTRARFVYNFTMYTLFHTSVHCFKINFVMPPNCTNCNFHTSVQFAAAASAATAATATAAAADAAARGGLNHSSSRRPAGFVAAGGGGGGWTCAIIRIFNERGEGCKTRWRGSGRCRGRAHAREGQRKMQRVSQSGASHSRENHSASATW